MLTEFNARAKVGTEKSKSLTISELRKICKEFALGYVARQREQFKRLGVFADWDNPYVTLNPLNIRRSKLERLRTHMASKEGNDL